MQLMLCSSRASHGTLRSVCSGRSVCSVRSMCSVRSVRGVRSVCSVRGVRSVCSGQRSVRSVCSITIEKQALSHEKTNRLQTLQPTGNRPVCEAVSPRVFPPTPRTGVRLVTTVNRHNSIVKIFTINLIVIVPDS